MCIGKRTDWYLLQADCRIILRLSVWESKMPQNSINWNIRDLRYIRPYHYFEPWIT